MSLVSYIGVVVALVALLLIVRTWRHEAPDPRQRGGRIYPGGDQ